MTMILGIDQGASHTRAAVCDLDGNILARARSDGAVHSFDGMERAMQGVHDAAHAALDQAGVQTHDVAIVYAGMTGADWRDEYDLLRENVTRLGLGDTVHIANDCIIAMRGGTSQRYGAILIAGTGGNCAVRAPGGEEMIFHFYQEGELQGGTALGYRVLNAIYRAETGREPPTRLRARVLAMFNFTTVDDLLRAHVERRLDGNRVKDIAPPLFEIALEGDLVASRIIESFGGGLAELVVAGFSRLGMLPLDAEVVLSGSIFRAPGDLLKDVIAARIHLHAPRARIVSARYEPVVGALLLGLEAYGSSVTEAVMHNVERSSQRLGLLRV